MASQSVREFQAGELERLCKVLAETHSGLTGTEIAVKLGQARIVDIEPSAAKWKRLYAALASRQQSDRAGNSVLSFVRHALEPARFLGNASAFEAFRGVSTECSHITDLSSVMMGSATKSRLQRHCRTLMLAPVDFDRNFRRVELIPMLLPAVRRSCWRTIVSTPSLRLQRASPRSCVTKPA